MERRDFFKIGILGTLGYLLSGCTAIPNMKPGEVKTVSIGDMIATEFGEDFVSRSIYLSGLTNSIVVDYREAFYDLGTGNSYARPAFNRTLYFPKRVGTVMKVGKVKVKVIGITSNSITVKRIA